MKPKKRGLGSLFGMLFLAVPVAAGGYIIYLKMPSSAPEAAPAEVAAPQEPERVAVAPAYADVGRKQPGSPIALKPTGRSRASSVGVAPEPPEGIFPPTETAPPRSVYGGGGAQIHGMEQHERAERDRAQREREARLRPEPGVTYREAMASERDPLLPAGSPSTGSTTTTRRAPRSASLGGN